MLAVLGRPAPRPDHHRLLFAVVIERAPQDGGAAAHAIATRGRTELTDPANPLLHNLVAERVRAGTVITKWVWHPKSRYGVGVGCGLVASVWAPIRGAGLEPATFACMFGVALQWSFDGWLSECVF